MNTALKQFFDVFIALILIVPLSPLLLAVALLVRLKMGRPVFFLQERPGSRGRPFTLIKFRTMTGERDAAGALLPEKERLTPLGRFLRRTSLDELPELVNVLKGEMSLVGPRPLRMEYLPLYTPEQSRRHEVKPGITGWAQVNGRNLMNWEEKFRYDVWYVDHRSFLLDLQILLRTFARVLKREGIGAGADPTMPRFTGGEEKR